MSKKIESMINFKYFVKLRKTKSKTATEFFSSFFSSQIPKKQKELKYNMNIFHFKEIQDSPEETLINELKKPITESEINLLNLSSKKLNNYLNNSNNHYHMERNINTMLNIILQNKKCLRYFIFNSLTEKYIRILLSFSEHELYQKGLPIYKYNSKPNAFYLVIRGKVSLRSLNQEKIKNEINTKNCKFLEILKKIEVEDKFNGLITEDYNDKIPLEHFVSKTNIISKHHDDDNVQMFFPKKQNITQRKDFRKSFRRSFTKDYNAFQKELNQEPKKIIENKILIKNLIDLQRNLSCEVKSYGPGDFFGDLDLIMDKPHPETAYAEENTDLLILNKRYFDKYFLKQLIKVDNERRLFLTKRIDFLHVNNVVNLKPEFYDKDEVIYTQFDFAKAFYIIYKGRGALKEIKNNECKKKGDVIFHKNNMKTLCLVDRGCVVGMEACKEGQKKYDNNFIITEDNTIIYTIKMRGLNDDNYLKKKNRLQLKKELGALYMAQNDILPKNNNKKKKLNKEELKFKKKEDKINNLFIDAKDYYWRAILSQNKMHMKISTFSNLNDINKNKNMYYSHSNWNKFYINKRSSGKFNLKKFFSSDFNSNRIKNKTRNISFKYLTSIKKFSKDNLNTSFNEKGEIPKNLMFRYTHDTSNSHKLDTFNSIANNYTDYSYIKKTSAFMKSTSTDIYLPKTFHQKFKKDPKFLTLNNNIFPDILNEENNKKDYAIQKFKSVDINKMENYFSLKKTKKFNNILTKPKNKVKITLRKDTMDKYIEKTAKISNSKNINYNSGYFKIPLIGGKS